MMATEEVPSLSRVTDTDMRFFQFRARQLLLLRREDHAWREFCRRNTCTCCSCVGREVAVQADTLVDTKVQSGAHSQSRPLPQELNEIRTKLERIDLALSGKIVPSRKRENTVEIFPEANLPINIAELQTLPHSINAERMELIQSSLKQSLQRLQSSAPWKNTARSVQPKKKKSSGFFLPHELQKQRVKARNAYLASLSKSRSHPQPIVSKSRSLGKQAQERTHRPKVILKSRPMNYPSFKTKEKDEYIAANQLKDVKDQSIEVAVDGILDDLMGETVLVLNKIKLSKSGTSAASEQVHEIPSLEFLSSQLPAPERTVSFDWTKIRHNMSQFKKQSGENSSSKCRPPLEDSSRSPSHQFQSQSQSAIPQTTVSKQNPSDSLTDRRLIVDAKTAQEIKRHRNEYARYLERVSMTRRDDFDSCTLANMISEFLLDECIEEISEEVLDAPGCQLTDLYNQEFLQTL